MAPSREQVITGAFAATGVALLGYYAGLLAAAKKEAKGKDTTKAVKKGARAERRSLRRDARKENPDVPTPFSPGESPNAADSEGLSKVGAVHPKENTPAREERRFTRWPDGLCSCGVSLQGMSAEERRIHPTSERHRRNIYNLGGQSQVVVCEEIGEYRAAATAYCGPDDCVLEVGSHVGGTTKFIASTGCQLVGVDQQADLVAQARERLPGIQFEVADAFDAPKMIALANKQRAKRFTKVFFDISGSRDITTVIRLVDQFRNTLKPDLMVVKSQTFKRLLLCSQLWVEMDDCKDPKAKNGKAGATD